MLQFKNIVGIAAGLLLIPIGLIFHPLATVKKIVPLIKDEPAIISENVQEPELAREGGGEFTVSRGSVDRNSVQVLAQVIEGEASGEPYEGKVAVGAVIINRSESSDFPNTIPGVVYKTGEFESVSNGQYHRPLSSESMDAALDALNGSDPTGGALYFWNPSKSTSKWVWSRPIVTQIGGHVFAR